MPFVLVLLIFSIPPFIYYYFIDEPIVVEIGLPTVVINAYVVIVLYLLGPVYLTSVTDDKYPMSKGGRKFSKDRIISILSFIWFIVWAFYLLSFVIV